MVRAGDVSPSRIATTNVLAADRDTGIDERRVRKREIERRPQGE